MTPINFHKKEKPLTSLVSMGGGAAGMANAGLAEKVYIDEVFSTYLYKGSSSSGSGPAQTITNGVDLAEEGGLVWLKSRTATNENNLSDTVNGAGKRLQTDGTGGLSTSGESVASFTNSGFTLPGGWNPAVNASNQRYVSWTFRKQKGFFDVVKFTGTGGTNASPQTISHSLKSIPGMIIIKNLTQASQWFLYHKATGVDKFLQLNKNDAAVGYNGGFKNITSSSIDVFDSNSTNTNEFIAYIFAGGESTAATARSVDFDGNGDQLNFAAPSPELAMGTGNFTCEFWIKLTGSITGNDAVVDTRSTNSASDGYQIYIGSNGAVFGYTNTDMFGGTTKIIPIGTWNHVAVVRDASNSIKLYVNGIQAGVTYTGTQNFTSSDLHLAANAALGTESTCRISNLRLTKGQALYTSSFRPPTEPLTITSQGATASNVKILACNNSSTTGGTVVPSTVQEYGQPIASTDSPFDDPDGFKFGEEGGQNIIRMGSYLGNNNANGPEINLGWEPQWVLIKNSSSTTNWHLFDSMRGIVDGGADADLEANLPNAEYNADDKLELTSTGFKITTTSSSVNADANDYIFVAIRRSDGYVGKPVEVGTEVFTTDTGAGTSEIPNFDANFPVDFAFMTTPGTSGQHRNTAARLTGQKYLRLNSHDAESGHAGFTYDWNAGWCKSGDGSNWQSWHWKRHAGMDVVTYAGNATAGRQIPHSLNKVPEMIWIKNRTTTGRDWSSYHKGFNGGVNPWLYKMTINHTDGERSNSSFFGTAPTAGYFGVGSSADTNGNTEDILAILFASVDGVSKVGSYDGSATSQTITTGFQPRMVIIKEYNTDGQSWWLLDTLRGWTSGNDNGLQLNSTTSQTSHNFGAPTATGFELVGGHDGSSNAGKKYIYYAHA